MYWVFQSRPSYFSRVGSLWGSLCCIDNILWKFTMTDVEVGFWCCCSSNTYRRENIRMFLKIYDVWFPSDGKSILLVNNFEVLVLYTITQKYVPFHSTTFVWQLQLLDTLQINFLHKRHDNVFNVLACDLLQKPLVLQFRCLWVPAKHNLPSDGFIYITLWGPKSCHLRSIPRIGSFLSFQDAKGLNRVSCFPAS